MDSGVVPTRVQTATRLAVGALLAGGELVGHFLDDLARAHPEDLPSLPFGARPVPDDEIVDAEVVEPDASPGVEGSGATTVTAEVRSSTSTSTSTSTSAAVSAPAGRDLGALAVGALVEAEERAFAAVAGAVRLAGRLGPSASWLWRAPMVDPVRRRVETNLDRLEARGRTEQELARTQSAVAATRALDGTVGTVIGADKTTAVVEEALGTLLPPIFDAALPQVFDRLEGQPELLVPLVEAIVGEVLGPILDTALPQVFGRLEHDPDAMLPLVESLVGEVIDPVLRLALPKAIDYLNEDPEVVRSLVRDQGVGMVGEMADTVRVRSATADESVSRIVARVLRRKQMELAPPPELEDHR